MNIIKNNSISLTDLFFSLFAFFMPLFPKILPVLLILSLLSLLYNSRPLSKKINFSIDKKFYLLILPVLLYFLFFISVFYSENKKAAYFDLEVKLSLLVIPLLFILFGRDKKLKLNLIFNSFITGSILSVFLFFSLSFIDYLNNNDINDFFYMSFSHYFHPSYLAMYYNFALILLLFKKNQNKLSFANVITMLELFILLLAIILLSSRLGYFTCFLIFISFLFFNLKNKTIILTFLIISVICFISLKFAYDKSDVFNSRINEIIISFKKGINKNSLHSTTSRLAIWKESLKLIKEKPLTGYGNGDVKDLLVKNYKIDNLTLAYEKKLNAHNQFLQTFISSGIFAFSILCLIFILSIVFSLKNKNYLFLSFLLLSIFNFFVESMLERQAGVLFFAFFYSLFIISLDRCKIAKNM